MWNKYDNYRTVRTLKEVVQLRLKFVAVPSSANGSLNPIDPNKRAVGHCPNRNLAYYVIAGRSFTLRATSYASDS